MIGALRTSAPDGGIAMASKGRIVAVNISTEKGTPRQAVSQIAVDQQGISGDAHADPWHRQAHCADTCRHFKIENRILPDDATHSRNRFKPLSHNPQTWSLRSKVPVWDRVTRLRKRGRRCATRYSSVLWTSLVLNVATRFRRPCSVAVLPGLLERRYATRCLAVCARSAMPGRDPQDFRARYR